MEMIGCTLDRPLPAENAAVYRACASDISAQQKKRRTCGAPGMLQVR
jgi:hypothetical protein